MKKVFLFIFSFTFYCFQNSFGQHPIGHTENFNDNLSDNWSSLFNFDTITEINGELELKLAADSFYHSFYYSFDTLDLSTNDNLSLKIKSTANIECHFTLIDAKHDTTGTFTVHLVPGTDLSEYTQYYIGMSNFWFDIKFDGMPVVTNVDSSQIIGLITEIYTIHDHVDTAHVYFEDLFIGDQATIATSTGTGYLEEFTSFNLGNVLNFGYLYDTLEITNSELVIKTEGDSADHGIAFQFDPIDIKDNPYLSFNIKNSDPTNINAYLINTDGYYVGNYNFQIDTSSTVYFNFTNEFEFNFGVFTREISTLVNTIVVFISNRESTDGVVQIDSIRIGDEYIAPVAKNTGLTESFDQPLGINWFAELSLGTQTPSHTLTVEDDALKIEADKVGFDGIWFEFDLVDISLNPYLSYKAKTDNAAELKFYLWDYKGNYNTGSVETLFDIDTSSEFNTYYINFEGQFSEAMNTGGGKVDSTLISKLLINIAPNNSYQGTFWIDDIKLGDQAERYINIAPSIDTIIYSDTLYLSNGVQEINITGISSGDSLSVVNSVFILSSNKYIIPSPVFSFTPGDTSIMFTADPVGGGNVTLSIVLSDNGNKYTWDGENTFTKFISIIVIDDVSDIKMQELSNVKIYPNPASSYFNISIPDNTFNTLIITDISGKKIMEKDINNLNTFKINTSDIQYGIYLIHLSGTKQESYKLILNK